MEQKVKLIFLICVIAALFILLYSTYLTHSTTYFSSLTDEGKNIVAHQIIKPKSDIETNIVESKPLNNLRNVTNTVVQQIKIPKKKWHETKFDRELEKLLKKKYWSSASIHADILKHPLELIPEDECSAPFVSVLDGGRLGNKVGQLMTLMLLRKHFGVRVAMYPKTHSKLTNLFENLAVPQLPHICFSENNIKTIQFGNLYNTFYLLYKTHKKMKKNKIKFNKAYPPFIEHFNYMNHHPCPIDLLKSHREEFKSKLKIRDGFLSKGKRNIYQALTEKNLNPEGMTLVSVHIRRTDYIKYAKLRNRKYPNKYFFTRAMNFFRERCKYMTFVIISDDIEWALKSFNHPDVIFPGSSNITTPELDYGILTLCHHHIIGLGTFGSTSAFLGNGSVAYYVPYLITDRELSQVKFNCESSTNYIPISD